MDRAMCRVSAVVLAGRPNKGKLKDCASQQWEALIDICGRPMLGWVLDGLLGSSYVESVTLVAPRNVFAPQFESPRVKVVEPGETMVANALAGSLASPDSEYILVCTSDLPFITPGVVDRFIEQCSKRTGEFFYPVVPKDVAEARFPGVKRTYASVREGTFTGGNMILVKRSVVTKIAGTAEKFVEYRKSPVKQAGLLGFSFVIKLLLHTLTISELEATMSRTLGAQSVAIISSDAEIGVDVDKPSDLELARKYAAKLA